MLASTYRIPKGYKTDFGISDYSCQSYTHKKRTLYLLVQITYLMRQNKTKKTKAKTKTETEMKPNYTQLARQSAKKKKIIINPF